MVDDDETSEPRAHPFKPGNIGPGGDYVVGKNRPPQASRFAVGDGRRRGRRPKGQRNFDAEFTEEANRTVTLRENGKERKVTKLRSTIVRAFDNAGGKGQNQAIATIFSHSARLADKVAPSSGGLSAREDALIEEWLARRQALGSGDPAGDPEQPPADHTKPPDEEGPGDE